MLPSNAAGGIKLLNIVFASRNEGKIGEVKTILDGSGINLLSLNNYQNIPEIVEDGHTFFENALKKARTVSELTGEAALADDSGLVVDALDGAPGICSSRYSGENATDAGNIAKLLHELRDVPVGKRDAMFVCVLVLYYPGGNYLTFEGRWRGRVAHEPAGTDGFGYDPVFFIPERGLTAAQLSPDIKNRISHRALALKMLTDALAKGQVPEPVRKSC